ncbi:hypothetical protein [Bradyrhizobium sp. USDA 4502]
MGARDDEGLYQFAGPGRKRREKLTLAEIPRRIARPKSHSRSNFGLPVIKRTFQEDFSEADIKEKVRRLVLDYGMSHADICETLKREGYSVTAVTVSTIRSHMLGVLRMLMRDDIRLVDPAALKRYRRRRSR